MNYLPSLIFDHRVIDELVETAKFSPDGCFVEVGVYQGGTASHLTELAEKQDREIYLYDTFEGLPFAEDIDPHKVGEFAEGVDYESIKAALPYANLVKGIFPDSAIDMPKIAFLHLDVDQYQSYVECMDYLIPRMAKGGIIWFDDYELAGAKKAIDAVFKPEKLIYANCGHNKIYTIIK